MPRPQGFFEKPNETKIKIMTQAQSLIKQNGYDNVTINDICAAAQISKHTFYYYFTSKDDILVSFLIIPRELNAENLADILNAENYFEQYLLLLAPIHDFFENSGVEIAKRILIINLSCSAETFHPPASDDKFLNLEHSILTKAQQTGDIRNSSDIEELVRISFSMMMSSVMFWSMSGGMINFKDLIRFNLEVLFDVPPALRKTSINMFRNHF